MARGDGPEADRPEADGPEADRPEADRPEDTCPRLTYRMEDAKFRDRVRRAYVIAATGCLNTRAGLALISMARTFRELPPLIAGGPVRVVEQAFLAGRA